eukprot:Phypoly_transcript_17437.p1 GENE.Phypoly_transcript_17437~~Phypoly_transcript_17437.p1  ORF type:complete len:215 (+),score=30.60 Phypoly_transcript_17437:98-742(+)
MKGIVVLAVLSSLVLCALSIPPPIWPATWSSQWKFVYSTNGSAIDGGDWYYDATTNQLRQDNYHHCNAIQNDTLCSAIFTNGNMYYNMPTINYCCLCWTNLSITEPNWLENTSYSGESDYSLLDPPVPSSVWTWNEDGQHLYYQSESGMLPVAESGWGTDMQWIGVKTGSFDTSVFDLYDTGCLTRQCPKNTMFCGTNSENAPKSLLQLRAKTV